MALKIITCPWCGKEARITYEENRLYQMKCYSCHNTMLHEDRSFDGAVEFFEHHANLLQAEKDGKLVLRQCKNGDSVYVVGECRVMQCFIEETFLDDLNGIKYLVSFICDNDCEGCPFNSWHQDYSGEYSCEGEWGQASINGADIGKTVFLTSEEAEAAIQKENRPD